MSIGMPYIGIPMVAIGAIGIPMGMAIGTPIPGMSTGGALMFGGMVMFHMGGRGGTGTSLRRRELPVSDAMDVAGVVRRLPLLRRSRGRTSCCDEAGVGTPECMEDGREPVPDPEPYMLLGRESSGEPVPEPEVEPRCDWGLVR